MSWERDPLWAKARLFFKYAFAESSDDPLFGLWCSLGLELLARAALSSISPTLLAEPDDDHKFLLHALNKGSERVGRKSIASAKVFSLCRTLFPGFSEEHLKAATALINRRNEELHTGAAAFAQYPPKEWLVGFYDVCRSLTIALNESLESLLGAEEAAAAAEMLSENRNDVQQRVQSTIAAHRKVFQAKSGEEQAAAKQKAETLGAELAHQRQHRVTCPACGCVATVRGKTFGDEHVTHNEGEIVVTQAVGPNAFSCSACSLNLQGYTELDVAKLGGHYTRTTTYSPEEYYGLVNLDTFDMSSYIEEYLRDQQEYDNE